MSDDIAISTIKQHRNRLQYLKEYFEEKERRVLAGELYREIADDVSMLFDEYMQLHLKYGERRPPGESGLVVFYRKLLRLQEETGK